RRRSGSLRDRGREDGIRGKRSRLALSGRRLRGDQPPKEVGTSSRITRPLERKQAATGQKRRIGRMDLKWTSKPQDQSDLGRRGLELGSRGPAATTFPLGFPPTSQERAHRRS